MMLEERIRDVLTADAGLVALVGSRIHPDPTDRRLAAPYVTFSRVTTSPTTYMDGDLEAHDVGRFQFDIWADGQAEVSAVAEALIAALYASDDVAAVYQNQSSLWDADGRRRGCAVDFLLMTSRT